MNVNGDLYQTLMKGAGVIKRNKKQETKRTREGGSGREDVRESARARKLDQNGDGGSTDRDARMKEPEPEESEKKMSSAEAQWKEAQE